MHNKKKKFAPKPMPKPLPKVHGVFDKKISELSYVVFDIETTGGNATNNGLTEFAALKYENEQITDQYHTLINPGMKIPPFVQRMTGIDNKMVDNAPKTQKVLPEIREFFGQNIIVSHNVMGDVKFISHYYEKQFRAPLHNVFVCTHLLTERLYPQAPQKSLQGIAEFLGVPVKEKHRAEEDARVTLEIFKSMLAEVKKRGIETLEQLLRFQGDFESLVRLGWRLTDDDIERVPKSAGVLALYDNDRKFVFAAASHQMSKDLARLNNIEQVGRNILKATLRAQEVKFERTFSYFDAIVRESELLRENPHLVDPSSFQQRVPLMLKCYPSGNQTFSFSLGAISEKDEWSIGPFETKDLFWKFIKEFEASLKGKKLTKSFPFILVDSKIDEIEMRNFYNEVSQFVHKRVSQKKNFWTQVISFLNKWKKPERKNTYQIFNAHDLNGIFFIPRDASLRTQGYFFHRSALIRTENCDLDENKFIETHALSDWIKERVTSDNFAQKLLPHQALFMNKVFWFLQHMREEDEERFYSLG